MINSSFNTVNGKYCCNFPHGAKKMLLNWRFNTVNGKYCCNYFIRESGVFSPESFNTVNGKYCCNEKAMKTIKAIMPFQYRKR